MNRLIRTVSFIYFAFVSPWVIAVDSPAASAAAATPAAATTPAAPATPAASATPGATEATPPATVVTMGPAVSHTCAACHGPDGNSTVPNWPKIAGQWEDYLVKQLVEYRKGQSGPRFEPSMAAMAAPLSDQDIHELAAFYASQKQTIGKTDPAMLTLGEKIYRGGDLEHGVAACVGCHAPDGSGNQAAKFPRLGGQHALYIENQLRAFREGKRTNSPSNMMHDISVRMTDEQIKAVSSYIEGLH